MGSMRFLVTTDLEETWHEHQEILFLGEWCRRYDRKNVWERRIHTVLGYHWDDRSKLKNDYACLQAVNERLLEALVPIMNSLHGEYRDKRFWRLLLGYWLNIYTTVVFDRWESIKHATAEGHLQTYVLSINASQIVCCDTADFIYKATEDSLWNHAIYALLLEKKSNVERIMIQGQVSLDKPKDANRQDKSWIFKTLRGLAKYALRLKQNDRFLLSKTYLPLKSLLCLEFKLGQLPVPIPHTDWCQAPRFDPAIREWSLPLPKDADEFDVLICELLPKIMPSVFLENYHELMAHTERMGLPSKPRIIFTSNQHFTNDCFKAWAGQKLAAGARLVIGEHGGMGAGLFNGTHNYELGVADAYLTTGWLDALHPKIVPFANFRKREGTMAPDKKGKALLVCGIMPRYAFDARSMMLASQVLDYFDDQFRFLDALPVELKPEILVRLTAADYGWEQKNRWRDRFPEIMLDEGHCKIWNLAQTCRLYIATYNATSYLESLSYNFPTVMFWNPERWELKPEAVEHFSLLKAVGICHETPESAAKHIASIWNDVSAWWCSSPVQGARKTFCDTYVSDTDNIVGRLAIILQEESTFSRVSS